MKNKFIPVGDKVVVRIDPFSEKSKGGIIMASTTLKNENLAREEGIIMEMGETIFGEAYDDFRKVVHIGDKIAFARYAGKTLGHEDDDSLKAEYRVLKDVDILCVIKEDSKDE